MAETVEALAGTPGLGTLKLANLGPFENNVYLVWDTASGEAYVIDAGYEPERIAQAARSLGVRGILITHGHRDHHEHAGALRDLLGAPLGAGADDAPLLAVTPDFLIGDGDTFPLGGHELRAIHTPGHTPGSTCFLLGSRLFTGDTLFPGGPGNTDQDPRRFAQIIASIRDRLLVLPDRTAVCPGHGRDTSIGQERPRLDEWIARGW